MMRENNNVLVQVCHQTCIVNPEFTRQPWNVRTSKQYVYPVGSGHPHRIRRDATGGVRRQELVFGSEIL